MEKLKRTIFFWTLVLLFAVTAPIVVMRAKGYRFDFTRGVFVHSGTITLKTNPQEIDVYFNEEAKAKQLNRINNSFNVTGLIPREYEITVSAPDFYSWKKKAEVHSGLATEFWNILLIRKNYEWKSYNTQGISRFFISPKNQLTAYTQNSESGTTVKIMNAKEGQVSYSFFFPEASFSDSRKENIEWSPEEDFLSVPLQNKDGDFEYFIIDPAKNNSFSLNKFLKNDDLKEVRWDPQDKNYLFFLSKNSLYRASVAAENDITLIADNVSSFELSKTSVYFSKMPTELVYKSDLEGKTEKNQITYTFPQDVAAPSERLIIYDDSRIAFISENKDLFVYNKGEKGTHFKKLASSVEGIQFSNDGKKLLYWTENEISVYFVRDWNVQPTRSENEIQTITRYAEPIRNIQWFKDYEHVIFSTGPYVKIIELDSRDQRNCMDILKTFSGNPFLTYNHSLENLFFTDTIESKSDLYSIVLPEPGTILGL